MEITLLHRRHPSPQPSTAGPQDYISQNDYSKIINLDLTEGKFDDFLGQNQFLIRKSRPTN
jgi:hypothetical protein